ncbi:glycine dehydrogenase, partial [Azospirillum brasilense]|nr:glycine dehydrogenase [Azospirillum brasilense]
HPGSAQVSCPGRCDSASQVPRLTGTDSPIAPMSAGATTCADARMEANRVTRRKKAVLSGGLHPHYRDTTTTDARFIGFETVVMPPAPTGGEDLLAEVDGDTSCVVVQNPDVFGHVRDYTELGKACQAKGALLIVVVTEAVSLGLLTPPGEMGADIVAAEGQSLGNALNFGGPYVGLFAVKEKLVRQMPGRLCGQTVDADGRRGFVLTLSTREQHIRREKATSNICTNSGLCALAFSIHLSLLGEEGFTRLAEINHAKAVQLADKLSAVPGVEIVNGSFF